jgi:hypothetical protein
MLNTHPVVVGGRSTETSKRHLAHMLNPLRRELPEWEPLYEDTRSWEHLDSQRDSQCCWLGISLLADACECRHAGLAMD